MSLLDRQLHPRWHGQAACHGQTHLMFSIDPLNKAAALRLCRGCDVRRACLAVALERREPEGIWGGLDEAQRRKLIKHLPDERIQTL